MNPLRIAFCGALRSGKDTAADHLQSIYGGKRSRFADPIYEIMYNIQDICGFPREKEGFLLQWIGTEYGRTKNPNVWVDTMVRRIQAEDAELTAQGLPLNNYFISDARFFNEFEALRGIGFTLICITRPDEDRMVEEAKQNGGNVVPRDPNHASEVDWRTYRKFHGMIHNGSTLEAFLNQVERHAE